MRQLELEAARRRAHRARVERLLTLARKHPDAVMSDMGFFFGSGTPNQQIFYATHATAATAAWQVWDKPRGCSMVYGVVLGAGGGAGAGFTGIATSARGGGGGGGGGGSTRFLVPAFVLPDRLYLAVGKGGAGGAASGSAGTAGQTSAVALYPGAGAGLAFVLSLQGNGGAAGTGSGQAAPGGGNDGSVQTSPLSKFLLSSGAASGAGSGSSGGVGGNASGVAGAAVIFTQSFGSVGGGGGGGTTSSDLAGGGQTSTNTAWVPSVAGGAAGSNRGTDGYWSWGPQFVGGLGGTGGGAANSGPGGAGGNGAYGCGGGGGGGGTTGGPGGNGGDGMIVLVAW